jgi:hypothetical protein
MVWVRGNRRVGAWLGLLALALQLIVSFGHIHLSDIAIPQAAAAAALADSAAAPNPGTPANRHHGTPDICAICVALNLTASSVVPTAASLVLPFVFTQAWLPDSEAALVSSEPHLFFQARAPPVLI